MNGADPVLACWSSGKDSAFSLEVALRKGVNVVGLLCTLNAEADRVAMHAVRRELLKVQAERLALALTTVELPHGCTYAQYETLMAAAIHEAEAAGIRGMIFGDLFLEDVRQHRIDLLRATSIEPVFPLWGRDTKQLAREIIGCGIKATVTCVDPRKLDPSFVARSFDEHFLEELPPSVDACGENGEFHTFVWDAPSFSAPIEVEPGVVIEREGFVFADVVARQEKSNAAVSP